MQNNLDKILDDLKSLKESLESKNYEKAESSIENMKKTVFESVYEKLMFGYIWEKSDIVDLLEYYMFTDKVKVKNILTILNKYYAYNVNELKESYISDEKYEYCQVIKEFL